MNRRWTIGCLLLFLLLCGGCRDREENDDLTVVAGIGVDGRQGAYQIITETLVAGGESEGGKRLLSESNGMTLSGALLETANLTAQQLYYTHAQTMVVSRELAEEGLYPLLSALERQNSFRLSLRLLVADGKAVDLVGLKEPQEDAASFQLRSMADTSWHNATSPDTALYRFLSDIGEDGVQGILPIAGLQGDGENARMEIRGTALFREDAMVGWLDDRDSQALLWMRESAAGGLLEAEDLALTVVRCRSRITCAPEGAVIRLALELQEQEGTGRKDVQARAQALAEERCQHVLEQLRALNCDAIGLGRRLMQQRPDQAARVKENWSREFGDYPVEIQVTTKIRDLGRIKEAVK